MIRAHVRAGLLAALLLGGLVPAAEGQVFLASQPNPTYTIGPLYIRASVTPELGVLNVDVFWSLVFPPGQSPSAAEGDLWLLWPSAVVAAPDLGGADPELGRFVEQRGFTSIEDGRVELLARSAAATGDRSWEKIPGGASFTTYVRQGGALGLSSPATIVRIPANPRLYDPTWMMRLRLSTKGLIKPKPATWAERAFWGRRYRLLLSYQDVNPRAIFPLYFENRARILRLAEDPAQLRIDFSGADHLKIDEIAPPSARRQMSETRDNTEVVTLFLDRSDGMTPQTLTIQFGYFSDLQSWAPILIPLAFFMLGNLAAPIVRAAGTHMARVVRARVHVGSPRRVSDATAEVMSPETLARIKPSETTVEELLRLGGPPDEEREQLDAPGRRLLVYRGRRLVPQRKRSWGWIGTVSHWEVEQQDVDVTVEGGIVRDVQARVRRARFTHHPGPDDFAA